MPTAHVGGVRRLMDILLAGILIVYPLLVYLGLTRFSTRVVAVAILTLLCIRFALFVGAAPSRWRSLLPLFVAGVGCAAVSAVLRSETALLFIPVAVSAVMLLTFGSTLLRGPSMVARFAALQQEELTPRIIAYCDNVTRVWCAFFVVNGVISAITVFYGSREYWTLYNGLISYLLMGALFGIEYLIRRRVQRRN